MGAILRWVLGLLLNQVFPLLPLGTLTANLFGGYCIGLALGVFAANPEIAPEWRLLVITGFLGALTTFSSFSAEVVILLQQQRIFLAMGAIALHVCGSLLMTFLGLASAQFFKNSGL
ncbi:MAG: fluoride efflux transporter CrcB [Deltaproteobacteria bacterium]|nr:fluoride efflux transporter CrcB [Deltaproteobacteria bacterium]